MGTSVKYAYVPYQYIACLCGEFWMEHMRGKPCTQCGLTIGAPRDLVVDV
jgi:hypothetical protein